MGSKHSKTSPSLEVVFEEGQRQSKSDVKEGTSARNKNGVRMTKLLPLTRRREHAGRKKETDNADALYVVGEDLPASVSRPYTPRRRQTSMSLADAPPMNNFRGSEQSLTSSDSEDSWHTDNSSLNQLQYQDYEYPFENVVFEGGGIKGLAYAGAIRELENIGVWKNIKRFAGTSAGSMWAALAAIGYNSYEVEDFLRQNLRKQFLDARFGYCSILPNLIKHFGWHPGRKIWRWFGNAIEAKTNNANITFKELYDNYGKELCVVVTNVNLMDTEYCHVKTTPSLPIRTAVRMSMAIPGLFGAVKYKRYGHTDVYVDGGVLCNYAIHCFDGWWLSLKPEDSFLRRLRPLHDLPHLWEKTERFGTVNEKTIGMLLFASDEQDLMVSKMERRYNLTPAQRPDTKLSRERMEKKIEKELAADQYAEVVEAFEMFFKVLDESQIDTNTAINREELAKAFEKSEFNDYHAKVLFGDDYNVSDVFEYLDINGDGEINFNELIAFAQRKGITIQNMFQGFDRRDITSVVDFLGAVQDTLLVNVKRVFLTEDDIYRTIGIDTLYLGTTDWDMEDEDKTFLVQQGERATRSFLRHYVKKNDPPLKKSMRADSDALTRPLHN